MPELRGLLLAYGATIGLAIPVGLWIYSRLLARLRDHHPEEYRDLGSPTLFMGSPSRGLALQGFVYGPGRRHADPVLRSECRRAAIFAGVLMAVLAIEIAALAASVIQRLG